VRAQPPLWVPGVNGGGDVSGGDVVQVELKKSAIRNKAVLERAERPRNTAASVERPASASVTWAAGGPRVTIRVAASVAAPRLSTSKMPPPSPPSVSFSCTRSPKIGATAAAMNSP
jgi:hypothetical protein